ncbi:response regulator [Cellulomonas endophytica]|uniref:response regulator n=1 Tax=Cellulomonas endophytica TaxID=2494735 RepID=UPI0010108909|nr:response regulator transcription factor [Cellulomonas endophytica]
MTGTRATCAAGTGAAAPLRVLVADDHAPTRETVREALEEGGCVVVAEAPDGPGAVAAALATRPDVCLLDIHMPGSGILAAAEITQELPGTPVVMLTASRDDEDLFAALRAGAVGYLPKDLGPDRVVGALRGVLAGEAALPPWLVLKVVQQFRAEPRRVLGLGPRRATDALTPREKEVLDHLALGLSTEEIAGRLFVAQVTVRTHVSTILKKLRVKDRAAAVRLLAETSGA